jgi:hypothetical protein
VEDFVRNPDQLCTRFTVESQATMERVHYTIQDTPGEGSQDHTVVFGSTRGIEREEKEGCCYLPWGGGGGGGLWWGAREGGPGVLRLVGPAGYGDDTDISSSIKLIVDFMVAKNEEYLAMEKDYNRTHSLASHEDPRASHLDRWHSDYRQ